MSYCPKCGAEVDKDDSFCPKCGSSLKEAEIKTEKSKEPTSRFPKKGIAIGVLLLIVCLVIGAVLYFNANKLPIGSVISTVKEKADTTPQTTIKETTIRPTTPKTTIKEPCPYECCDGERYQVKGCSGGTICVNNQCVKPDCPYECCDGIYYKIKECEYNKECVNHKCIKKACPYECCDGTIYQRKSCSSGYNCVNNRCEEIKKPKLSVTIEGCKVRPDIDPRIREITDVYITVTNYGTKDALNIQVSATSTDVQNPNFDRSRGRIGILPAGHSEKVKLTVDTKEWPPSSIGKGGTISVSVSCSECDPIPDSTSSQCYITFSDIVDELKKYKDIKDLLPYMP